MGADFVLFTEYLGRLRQLPLVAGQPDTDNINKLVEDAYPAAQSVRQAEDRARAAGVYDSHYLELNA